MSTPLRQLHYLDLLRTFVAVGRRQSMTLAASDLALTQSAVSRHIRALEEQLSTPLFIREHRSIHFTHAGLRLFEKSDHAIQQLQDAVGELSLDEPSQPVVITASIGFAGLWLLPKLGQFQTEHPDINIRIAADNRRIDLQREGVDIAIRYCAAHRVPDTAIRLFDEALIPVASPALGLEGCSLQSLFRQHYLLSYENAATPWLQWPHWMAQHELSPHDVKGIVQFNQYDQLIHAAVAGQGIALGRITLISQLIKEGLLTPLITEPEPAPQGVAYWLLQNQQPRASVQRVIKWLQQQSAHSDIP